MSFEIWLAFAVTSAALLAAPGPTVMIVVSFALGHGRKSGWATVPAVTLGDFTAMTVSLLGAGVVLAASATLFTVLKLAGAAYLIWLGVRLWRAEPTLPDAPVDDGKGGSYRKMFLNAYVVTALNPKTIVFFVAFVPQFVDPAGAAFPQFALLEATFLALAALNAAIWAILAGALRARFRRTETLRFANRLGVAFLIGAGALTAAVRRTA